MTEYYITWKMLHTAVIEAECESDALNSVLDYKEMVPGVIYIDGTLKAQEILVKVERDEDI